MKIILSICIPSYNRFEQLKNNIENILATNSDEFEVVIVDNKSTSSKENILSTNDRRLRFIERKEAVPGTFNIGNCLMYARGEFGLLCLDKDYVQGGDSLINFIECLKKNRDVYGGYCALNKYDIKNNVFVTREFPLKSFGYLSKHPSGDFYRMKYLRDFIEHSAFEIQNDPFSFDIYLAQCANVGVMMFYDIPLIYTESIEDAVRTASYSFHKEDSSLFFCPKNRIRQFLKYKKHLDSLELDNNKYRLMVTSLYLRTVQQVTNGFNDVMRNKEICRHYQVEYRQVHIVEMQENLKNLNSALEKELNCDFFKKVLIAKGYIKFLAYVLSLVTRKFKV